MRPDDLIRLRHILDAAREALGFVRHRHREDLDRDRQLEISEAGLDSLLGRAEFFARRFWRADHSLLRPMVEVAKLLRRHLPNVLTYPQHGITNAAVDAAI